jgi:hypothetical protein
MERVRVEMESTEYRGLARLAERNVRSVAGELRYLLREELKRNGLLEDEGSAPQPRDGNAA